MANGLLQSIAGNWEMIKDTGPGTQSKHHLKISSVELDSKACTDVTTGNGVLGFTSDNVRYITTSIVIGQYPSMDGVWIDLTTWESNYWSATPRVSAP